MSNVSKEVVVYSLALVCALLASISDIQKRKISNILTGTSVVLALGIHFVFFGWLDLGTSILSGLCAGGFLFLFYLAGGMGAGDVKLITAIGCFIDLHAVILLLFLTSLCGAVLGLVMAYRKRVLRETVRNSLILVNHHRAHGLVPHPDLNIGNTTVLRMPFALPIMMACLMTAGFQMWSMWP